MSDLTPYELLVIDEIAEHTVHPNTLHKALAVGGWPLEKVLSLLGGAESALVQKTTQSLIGAVQRATVHTISLGHKLTSDKDLQREFADQGVTVSGPDEIAGRADISLEILDRVADRYKVSNAVMVGTQGLLTGAGVTVAEALPILVAGAVAADVYASLTLLGRHSAQVASSYGYSPANPVGMRHLLQAMTPIQVGDGAESAGFLVVKKQVVDLMREAGEHLAKQAARAAAEAAASRLSTQMTEQELPLLIRAVVALSERLGLQVAEKELAALVPVAGGLLNGALNVTFQQIGHTTAKDYFRRQVLARRYGAERIDRLIAAGVERRSKAS